MLKENIVTTNDFVAEMRKQLRFLEQIGDDLDELASDERCARVSQELMGKSERIYDSVHAMTCLLETGIDCEGN
jgi:hypothetical protein